MKFVIKIHSLCVVCKRTCSLLQADCSYASFHPESPGQVSWNLLYHLMYTGGGRRSTEAFSQPILQENIPA